MFMNETVRIINYSVLPYNLQQTTQNMFIKYNKCMKSIMLNNKKYNKSIDNDKQFIKKMWIYIFKILYDYICY